MISEIHLNIGSNCGDSRAFIARAVAALRSAFGCTLSVSSEVESEPWGFVSANRFVNVGVLIALEISQPWTPFLLDTLLAKIKAIEKSISPIPHRKPDGSYADREIDIDIIAVDSLEYSSTALTLPHPHMSERRFVLEPLAELASGWKHPASGLTAAEMLARLKPCEKI